MSSQQASGLLKDVSNHLFSRALIGSNFVCINQNSKLGAGLIQINRGPAIVDIKMLLVGWIRVIMKI
ncbi:hypothetical protein E2C01_043313 [Portunus trituberculatus]|uniref:Uncharacterized protein n=1 Tax=Portunus trituberculatus TaxID=210409 RepID=A0A5B7FP57_PORTR|nr:hypothetical protein [Portunus trituberculatus]